MLYIIIMGHCSGRKAGGGKKREHVLYKSSNEHMIPCAAMFRTCSLKRRRLAIENQISFLLLHVYLIVIFRTCLLPHMREHSPLKDRVITRSASGCLSSSTSTSASTSTNRPTSYRDWNEHKMREALSAM